MASPLREILVDLGAHYNESVPADVPKQFEDPLQEYAVACETVAIIDVSPVSKLEIRGPDRAKFLQNMCTNDISLLTTGMSCEAFLTDARAKILGYIRVFATDDSFWIETVSGAAESIMDHLNRYIVMENVELKDRTQDFAQILVDHEL